MPIITVGSSKGGCGKTTTCLALASEIRTAKTDVCIIDADDQLSAFSWYEKWKARDHITVLNAAHLARDIEILAFIKDAAAKYPFVIIDPAGIRSQRLQWAASLSDLWIIPQKATSMDAKATANLFEVDMPAIEGMRGGRPIPHRVLFTMRSPMLRPNNEQHIIDSTRKNSPVFDAELLQYDAFAALDLYGLTLEEVQSNKVANAGPARECTRAILKQAIDDITAADTAKG